MEENTTVINQNQEELTAEEEQTTVEGMEFEELAVEEPADPTFDNSKLELRPYQQACVDQINQLESGSHLVVMATGLGKTVTLSRIQRRGRVLILSHRDELVHQPQKYFDCSFGIECAGEHSDGEEVVSASVMSLIRRLKRFKKDDFDMIITDEAHHAVAASYRKIYDYFQPRIHLGFTATPNRGDKIGLKHIYDDILCNLNIRWGIENGYLADVNCIRINIGYDLSKVSRKMGDYAINELGQAMNKESSNEGVAKAYYEYAKGQTLIFATNVEHARGIAKKIDGAAVITASTKNRGELLEKFRKKEVKCLINCMVFTEGTDLPMVETIIIARPTSNVSLYTQMVGRGLRLYPGKEYLTLIDCIGVAGKLDLCTAPSLFGLDITDVKKPEEITGKLTEMEEKITELSDNPAAWLLRATKIDLFARENNLDLQDINWVLLPDHSMVCSYGDRKSIVMTKMDELGRCDLIIEGDEVLYDVFPEKAIATARKYLQKYEQESAQLWDKELARRWESQPASDKQIQYIKRLAKKTKESLENIKLDDITKEQASMLISSFRSKLDWMA